MRRFFTITLGIFSLTVVTPNMDAWRALAAEAPSEKLETFKAHESLRSIWVDVHAPYPPEIDNETQARALAKEAATALGQNTILRYVLTKRTSKGQPLSEATIPSTDIQDGLKALISGAQVTGVRFGKDGCRLRVSVDKRNLKVILRK